jgi:AcrR family transcriptional regulator
MKIFDVSTRKGEICDIAATFFYEKGFYATGMREIATSLNMTVSNLYNFFSSKDELLFFVLESIIRAVIQNTTDKVDKNADWTTQLKQAIYAHIKFHGENQREAFISDSELRGLHGEMREKIIRYRDEHDRIFYNILEQGQQAGCFKEGNTKLRGIAIQTLCTQVSSWYRTDKSWDLEYIAENYWNIIYAGIKI